MGPAPCGQPRFAQAIRQHLIEIKNDGSFWMDLGYFNYCQGLTMTNDRFDSLFGGPPRRPESQIEQRHMDLAASIQVAPEEIILNMTREVHRQTGKKNLVPTGGVAPNCVANGRVLREGRLSELWIQPAAMQLFVRHRTTAAWVPAAIALIGGVGLLMPSAGRWLFVGASVIAFPIGWVVTQVVLVVMFYAVRTPLVLVFRWRGRDELHLRRKPEQASFWTTHRSAQDLKRYLNQF